MKKNDLSPDIRPDMLRHLTHLLEGGNAHVSFFHAVENMPSADLGIKPEGLPYSIWQLVEHIRITQWDILEFCRSKTHVSPKWPDEYWPAKEAPARGADWEKTLSAIRTDLEAFVALLSDARRDLLAPLPWGEGQCLFSEAMLIADHTSYHTGEILVLRRLLGSW